jgi:WD40 repeat protein
MTQRLTLWDVEQWREVRYLEGHEQAIAKVAFSADGKWALSGDVTGKICYWRIEDGRQLACFDPPLVQIPPGRIGSTPGAKNVAFSPDGRLAACVHGNDARSVRILELGSGNQVLVLGDHEEDVSAAYFTPDGRQVVTAAGRSIRVWDWEDGSVRYRIPASERILCLAVGAEGSFAATGQIDGTVSVWDLKKGLEARRLTGHAAQVNGVSFSPRGEHVVSGSSDQTARIWTLSTKEEKE